MSEESITMREALMLDIEDLKRERDEARADADEWQNKYAEAYTERDEARKVAENLVEYAHECLVQLESWGKGYAKYEQKMETIREAIAGCEKWEEAAK